MDHDYDGVPADTRAEEINRTDRWVRESLAFRVAYRMLQTPAGLRTREMLDEPMRAPTQWLAINGADSRNDEERRHSESW